MSQIHKKAHIFLQLTGPIGSVISSLLSECIAEEEMEEINKKVEYLDKELKDFKISNYKLINRFKIRNLLIKSISENYDKFLDLACFILKDSEDSFEDIVDAFNNLTEEDLKVLYFNLWKKSKLPEFQLPQIKELIEYEYEVEPDLIFLHAYRVNKKTSLKKANKGLLLGNSLTIMPNAEINIIYNKLEKLAYNNLIRISMYAPSPEEESFQTYLCMNFTYVGNYICRAMEKLNAKI